MKHPISVAFTMLLLVFSLFSFVQDQKTTATYYIDYLNTDFANQGYNSHTDKYFNCNNGDKVTHTFEFIKGNKYAIGVACDSRTKNILLELFNQKMKLETSIYSVIDEEEPHNMVQILFVASTTGTYTVHAQVSSMSKEVYGAIILGEAKRNKKN